MELVYLTNGQSCYLKEKIGERFIVNKVFEYNQIYGENSEIVEFIDDNDIVVDVILKSPPIPKFSSEVSDLIKKKDELKKDIRLLISEKLKLNNEVVNLTTKITTKQFILNKTELINAKTLAFFPKNSIMPKVFDSQNKNFSGLKLLMETRINSNEENCWGYNIYFNESSSGEFLCPKYGVLINPTVDEIDETIKKRLSEFKFNDYQIASIDNKYLTPDQIEIKNTYLSNEKLKERTKLNKQLIELQEKIKENQKLEKQLIEDQEQINKFDCEK